jgi:beta-lactamase class A
MHYKKNENSDCILGIGGAGPILLFLIFAIQTMKPMLCKQLRNTILTGILFLPAIVTAQTLSLRQQIASICESKHAIIGVCVQGIESGDTLSFNGVKHFPMQSVFKFPMALYILSQVDKGKLSLNQQLFISKKELLPDTWSPLRDSHPGGNFYMTLRDLLQYTIFHIDNNGCDILFRLAGGPDKVNHYIHGLGMKNISIKTTEAQMHSAWNVQFSNWATPVAVTKLLVLFYSGKILSPATRDFLLKMMEETSTGTNKIKGLLPPGTLVAHKSGLSDRNKKGIRAADNDAGIVTLPDGTHFAITIFVAQSSENDETNARITAEISKAAWDHFNARR